VKRLVPSAAILAAGLLLAACSSGGSDLTDSYNQGDAGGGYISGDGRVVTVAAADRDAPAEFGGALDTGGELDSSELDDTVVVLNFWYANCPPCRTEAPQLKELEDEYAGNDDVALLGVNVRDSAERAQVFSREFDLGYPSLLDAASNEVQLAFSGTITPNAVPTTLVLDREGRVAARISGVIDDAGLVSAIVDDVLAEDS
jgi:thiol-disulfide isomerase/thioredoxin